MMACQWVKKVHVCVMRKKDKLLDALEFLSFYYYLHVMVPLFIFPIMYIVLTRPFIHKSNNKEAFFCVHVVLLFYDTYFKQKYVHCGSLLSIFVQSGDVQTRCLPRIVPTKTNIKTVILWQMNVQWVVNSLMKYVKVAMKHK